MAETAGFGGDFAAMLRGAAQRAVGDAAWLRVSGEDRVRWLNGMVTNSIQGLGPGEGCFNFVLSAQGRIQGTAWAFAEPGGAALMLRTDAAQAEGLLALLDRFIIMDDVALEDVSGAWFGVEVFGDEAGVALAGAGLRAGGGVARLEDEAGARVVTYPAKVVPRFEVWFGAAAERDAFAAKLTEAGVRAAGDAEREWLRLLEGSPRFGQDIRERELPQETGQTGTAGPAGALHFNKGCYLGQEIVERIRSRGAVHRGFHGFRLVGGELPAPGAVLEAEGKPVGELTSVGEVPAVPGYPDGLRLGLGYVRREAVELGRALTVAGTETRAEVLALPVPLRAESGAHPTKS